MNQRITSFFIFYQVATLKPTQTPNYIQPPLYCRRQPPCKPGHRQLFDVQGKNINRLNTGNSVKAIAESAEAGLRARIVEYDGSIPEPKILEKGILQKYPLLRLVESFQQHFYKPAKPLNLDNPWKQQKYRPTSRIPPKSKDNSSMNILTVAAFSSKSTLKPAPNTSSGNYSQKPNDSYTATF